MRSKPCWRVPLKTALRFVVTRRRAGFQHWLFEDSSLLGVSETYRYEFKPDLYPARVPFYRGKYTFSKHYYPVIEDLTVARTCVRPSH